MSRLPFRPALGACSAAAAAVLLAGSAAQGQDPTALGEQAHGLSAVPPAAATQPADQTPLPTPLDLRSVERIAVKIRGFPDLSGDYRINADETISVPVLGRVTVANKDPAALERALTARMAEITGRDAFTTVEVAAYRPILVNGFVNKPGAVPWEPGTTVVHAVTLAGGLYRPGSTSGGSGSTELATSAELARVNKTTDDLKRGWAALARLRAERDRQDTIPVPAELVRLVGKAEAEELTRAELPLLTTRRKARDAQLDSIERARSLADKELAALNAQRTRIDDQVRLRRSNKQKLDELLARGLVRSERNLEEEIKLSDLDEKAANITVSIARVQSTISGLQREALVLRQERPAPVEEDLTKTQRLIAQLEIELDAASTAYGMRAGEAAIHSGSRRRSWIDYAIMRVGPLGRQSATAADQFTPTMPGDLIIVTPQFGVQDASMR